MGLGEAREEFALPAVHGPGDDGEQEDHDQFDQRLAAEQEIDQ